MTSALIGREKEYAALQEALAAAGEGAGGLILLRGEAGVGKTHLANALLDNAQGRLLRTAAREEATPSYGPVVALLRAAVRRHGLDLEPCGLLARYLGLLLPELGVPPAETDQATLFEAIRCAMDAIAAEPAVILIDDLQWADNATLELLLTLADWLPRRPLLLLGAYRSDEIPRGHPMRRLRDELRRSGWLREIRVDPLGQEDTGRLAAQRLPGSPSPDLVATLYARTGGMPLFVEELCATLTETGRLVETANGLALAEGADLPIPETVRDAVLLRLDGLGDRARTLLEAAAVAGQSFDLELLVDLAGAADGLDELLGSQLLIETTPGQAAFRHALTREAIYGEVLWSRRRELHRALAERLQLRGASPALVAEHWLAGQAQERARLALVTSADNACRLHAYRDAAVLAERALALWPEEGYEAERLAVLDQLANCAQLSGLLPDAARAWREVAAAREAAGDWTAVGRARRRLATVYELQGAVGRTLETHQQAADALSRAGEPGEAASARLAASGLLSFMHRYSAALPLAQVALQEAEAGDRADVVALARSAQGVLLAKLSRHQQGLSLVQQALQFALDQNLTGPAAVIYQDLGKVAEQQADYETSHKAYDQAMAYCESQGNIPEGQVCMACLSGVLWLSGEWGAQEALVEQLLARDQPPDEPAWVRPTAISSLGQLYVSRGKVDKARPLLLEAEVAARHFHLTNTMYKALHGLAMIDDLEGDEASAQRRIQEILAWWRDTDDLHFVVPALRWGATFHGRQNQPERVRELAQALARVAGGNPNPESLGALAHALGEAALAEGDTAQAVVHFRQAVEQVGKLQAPYQRAETAWRAGVALAADGQGDEALRLLTDAYHLARNLGARPLQAQVAAAMEALGFQAEERIGARGIGREASSLTRRQQQVLRLVAQGLTNQEIAASLVLSPRTVDMHVSNILERLDVRSRTEAVSVGAGLGLLD